MATVMPLNRFERIISIFWGMDRPRGRSPGGGALGGAEGFYACPKGNHNPAARWLRLSPCARGVASGGLPLHFEMTPLNVPTF